MNIYNSHQYNYQSIDITGDNNTATINCIEGADEERICSLQDTIIYLESNMHLLMKEVLTLREQVKALNKSL